MALRWTKSTEKLLAFTFGLVFVMAVIALAVAFPKPSQFQYLVFRMVLALAAAGIAAMIPGFIQVNVGKVVRAGGAIAVFLVVLRYTPADLVADVQDPLEAEVTIAAGTYKAEELVGILQEKAGNIVLAPGLETRLLGKTVKLLLPMKGVPLKAVLDNVLPQVDIQPTYRTDKGTVVIGDRRLP